MLATVAVFSYLLMEQSPDKRGNRTSETLAYGKSVQDPRLGRSGDNTVRAWGATVQSGAPAKRGAGVDGRGGRFG